MDLSSACVPCKSGYITFLSSPTNRFIFFNANRLDKKETILFCDAVENLIVSLPKALEKALSLTEDQIQADPGVIFTEDLSCFSGIEDQLKKTLMFKNSLSVNTYQSNVYIWIKRYFFDSDKQIWSACRGGFRFAPKLDNFEEILNFLKKNLEIAKSRGNNKNGTNHQVHFASSTNHSNDTIIAANNIATIAATAADTAKEADNLQQMEI